MRSSALVWSGGERPGARVPARVTAPADLQLPARSTRSSLHVDSEWSAGTQVTAAGIIFMTSASKA